MFSVGGFLPIIIGQLHRRDGWPIILERFYFPGDGVVVVRLFFC